MIRTFRPIPVKKIKLIVFDLDGTLIDSELDLAASVNAMLRYFGRKELPHRVDWHVHWGWRAHAHSAGARRSRPW